VATKIGRKERNQRGKRRGQKKGEAPNDGLVAGTRKSKIDTGCVKKSKKSGGKTGGSQSRDKHKNQGKTMTGSCRSACVKKRRRGRLPLEKKRNPQKKKEKIQKKWATKAKRCLTKRGAGVSGERARTGKAKEELVRIQPANEQKTS